MRVHKKYFGRYKRSRKNYLYVKYQNRKGKIKRKLIKYNKKLKIKF